MITLKEVGAITVQPCEHTFDPRNHPRHANCEHCWTAYFDINRMAVVTARSMIKMFGKDALVKKFGTKYSKRITPFVEALIAKEQQEAHEESLNTETVVEAT